jgi:hypothetical protein
MIIVYCLVWALIATVTTWGIMTVRSSSAIARLQWAMRKEIAHWQAETSRARAYAAQIAKDAAARAEGWKRGRDDTIEIIPLIVSAHDRVSLGHDGAAGAQPAAEDNPEII